ncbi:MAG TPA: hypothetical protein PLP05_09610 [Sedimentisphaerales bacterium]|nr:hypothetical protein [Sedimentisphaerales bacterium]
MKKLTAILVVAVFVLPAMAVPTVDVQYTNVSPGQQFDVTFTGYANYGVVYTGVYNLTLTNSTFEYPLNSRAFCIEPQLGTTTNRTYNVVDLKDAPEPQGPNGDPMGVERADLLRELFGRNYDSVVDNKTAAAFQLAVWEIVFDGSSNNFTAGNFFINSVLTDTITLASNWLAAIDGTGPMANLVGLSNLNYQDFVTIYTVPVPGAVILSSMGVALVGWFRRKTL